MTKENQEVYLEFIREANESGTDLSRIREALSGLAYYYHISAVEAEIHGDKVPEWGKEITLFERENASPVGEPAKYVFTTVNDSQTVVYFYADESRAKIFRPRLGGHAN